MKTKLEKLEKKIRELCPELMELSFGCEVSWSYIHSLNGKSKTLRTKRGWFIANKGNSLGIVMFQENRTTSLVRIEELVIIGHPITLEACLTIIHRPLNYHPATVKVLIETEWKAFQPWEKQTKVHELLYEIFNIK